MPNNGDTRREFDVNGRKVLGLGSFHKTLPHSPNGEVNRDAFLKFVAATEGDGSGFHDVPEGRNAATQFTNPQAGLSADQLTHHPAGYDMPPAPTVLSTTTAAEMTELYWMALCRDVSISDFASDALISQAATEINTRFHEAITDTADAGHLKTGIDVPGPEGALSQITPQNVFRLGLPGEEFGPLVSQFFIRDIPFGTQKIDQKQRPYKTDLNFLTTFPDWLLAQDTGFDSNFQAYPKANEHDKDNFEEHDRHISTMRDLARFVNKDALHQAYFNGALLLLSGGAKWTPGNPYGDCGSLRAREAGFGVLGGPHILALVSEVATRALKIVWNQKWQVHLRLRPEAYGGLLHVQEIGVDGERQPYGLPTWLVGTDAAKAILARYNSYLLPMAFTPGSPTHPAYGAGHATVAGACVTVLKAYFKTFETIEGEDVPILFRTLGERDQPYGSGSEIKAYVTGRGQNEEGTRTELDPAEYNLLTIEGELNKLASNVALGRSMGGVHWRTDNSRSLILGEAIAAEILADITTDSNERPEFVFRSFARKADGLPKKVTIKNGRIFVDGVLRDTHGSTL